MLYYTHVNEDNRIERQLLEESGSSLVVAVAGSGERVLSLMDLPCTELHVMDPNPVAIYLIQLKLAALQALSVEDYLRFCGHETVNKKLRLEWFECIKTNLPIACAAFWDTQRSLVSRGILNMGQYERFLSRIRPIIHIILGKDFPFIFLDETKTKPFPYTRWQLLCQLFSWRWIYRYFGNNDQAFVGKGANLSLIPTALDQIIRDKASKDSFMVHLLFKGHLRKMSESALPPSLQKQVLAKIKERIDNQSIIIHYHQTDALSFAMTFKNPANRLVFYSLSDLLSFEDHSYLKQVLELIASSNKACVVWRSFLRNRLVQTDQLTKNLPGKVHQMKGESTRMYQVFSFITP